LRSGELRARATRRATRRPLEAALHGVGFELLLRVEGYEFPQFHSGWDANALLCELELEFELLGRFRASHRPILYTVELEHFTEQLKALDRDPSGEATLEHGAEELGLRIRLTCGKGTLEGFLADHTASRLSFEHIDVDRAFLRRAIDDLQPILDAYPVRGALQID